MRTTRLSNYKPATFVCIFMLLVVVSGCNSGSDSSVTDADTLLQDPIVPVQTDTTIGGEFEGEQTTPLIAESEFDDSAALAAIFNYRDEETNNLSDDVINRVPDFTYEAFEAAFEAVSTARPELSTSSDEFAINLIDQLTLFPQSDISSLQLRNIFVEFSNLTAAEQYLSIRNPRKALRSRSAATAALVATDNLFTGSKHLTRADAFRHAYWNWLMSQCCTVAWATAFATAHESEVPNNDDKRMDLNNNIIGRRLFSASPESTAETAQTSLLDYNLLWLNSDTKDVTVGIDFLVYLEPEQKIRVFDDGPVFDDIYTIGIDGNTLGDTPAGGGRDFLFDQIPSGDHPLSIVCKIDGTGFGCGFEIVITGASTLSTGIKTTTQIVIEESETYNETLAFPNLNQARSE